MSNSNRPNKKRFRSDGTSIWTKRGIDGPGVWVSCVKGKEKQAIGEIYELFESLAEQLWPTNLNVKESVDDNDNLEEEEDLEKAITKEVENLKRPRKERRFASCPTDTPCMIFMSCKPPVDPVKIVNLHMKTVGETGVTHSKNVHRLVPISSSCDANIAEITSLCQRIVKPAFETDDSKVHRYKIELRIRNHNTVSREEVIKAIAACVPDPHKVDLSTPEFFVLVEIFKGVCGISVVQDYYRFKKFNVIEVSQARLGEDNTVEPRVGTSEEKLRV